MPIYAIIAQDDPATGTLRADTRPRHLDYLHGLGERIVRAGPLLDEDGKAVGSLLLVEADDIAAARGVAAADPYAQAGLFADVRIQGWRQVIPAGG